MLWPEHDYHCVQVAEMVELVYPEKIWQGIRKGPLTRTRPLALCPWSCLLHGGSKLKVQPYVTVANAYVDLRKMQAWWRMMGRERKGGSPALWSALGWVQRWIKWLKTGNSQHMGEVAKEESSAWIQSCITTRDLRASLSFWNGVTCLGHSSLKIEALMHQGGH